MESYRGKGWGRGRSARALKPARHCKVKGIRLRGPGEPRLYAGFWHSCNDHQGFGHRIFVGEREIDLRGHSGRRQCRQAFRRAAGHDNRRSARELIDDAEIAPIDAGAKPGAEGFRRRFLGGIALGQRAGVSVASALAAFGLALLGFGENPPDKFIAEPRQGFFRCGGYRSGRCRCRGSCQLARLLARAASIAARMRSMAAAKPMKIASPTRKWPMFNSAMVAIAAIGPTVS